MGNTIVCCFRCDIFTMVDFFGFRRNLLGERGLKKWMFTIFERFIGIAMEICDMVISWMFILLPSSLIFLLAGTTDKNRDNEIIKLIQADNNDDSDMTKLW